MARLANKVAIITGAASGQGQKKQDYLHVKELKWLQQMYNLNCSKTW